MATESDSPGVNFLLGRLISFDKNARGARLGGKKAG